jgi:hypothetical protein
MCGPMWPQKLGGSYYFLTFISDYNKNTLVYFISKKYETLDKFKEFKALVEK